MQDRLHGPDGHEIVDFIVKKNEQFFLNLAMVACKSLTDPVRDIPHSTIITAMSRNGVNFGINISALGGEWFTAPCLKPKALYFPGYSEADANPDMGDSAIVECCGLGGFAIASAPAVVRFVEAGGIEDALLHGDMGRITQGGTRLPMPTWIWRESPRYRHRKVVATGIAVINQALRIECPNRPGGSGRRHPAMANGTGPDRIRTEVCA
jgi:hypothetical protein